MTTINEITPKIEASLNLACGNHSDVIIVGDEKTPNSWRGTPFSYLDLNRQDDFLPNLSRQLRRNHYCRKNIGYLYAASEQNEWIFETDDDNYLIVEPSSVFNKEKFSKIEIGDPGWINPYDYFNISTSQIKVWPRGYPLEKISETQGSPSVSSENSSSILLQGLANGNPDVDAIFRLVNSNYENFKFIENQILRLSPLQMTPINSQTTWWHRSIFRLMYLPSFSTFRVTDILRGYIATHILAQKGLGVEIFSPIVYQERNQHNLLSDFVQEIPLYTESTRFLSNLSHVSAPGHQLISTMMKNAFELAIEHGLTDERELASLEEWQLACDQLKLPN
jgi:hypothetical protein